MTVARFIHVSERFIFTRAGEILISGGSYIQISGGTFPSVAEDIPANDDDSPIYQFDNCHVYMNSFNARGVKVKNSGNHAPRVTHHGGTAPNEGPPLSSKLSRPELSIGPSTRPELREDSVSYASDDSLSAPPVGIDLPFPTFEQKQPTKRDKLPATDPKLMQSNPAPTTLPDLEFQPHPINPFLPIHMGLHPNLLSHILQPDDAPNNTTANNWDDFSSSTNLHPHRHPATPNPSRHRPDTSSKSLEHHLDSALAILIQSSGILAEGVTPQARNTLKAINALVPMETPTHDPPPRFKSVRKVAKWFQFSRSPK